MRVRPLRTCTAFAKLIFSNRSLATLVPAFGVASRRFAKRTREHAELGLMPPPQPNDFQRLLPALIVSSPNWSRKV